MLIFTCLLDNLIRGFCYNNLSRKTGELELASTITLVLQANRLIKFASHPYSSEPTSQLLYNRLKSTLYLGPNIREILQAGNR